MSGDRWRAAGKALLVVLTSSLILFVSLRWQRGIMMYDATCQRTPGILLGDYLKSVITGQNLPADLAQDATNSPLLAQYALGQPDWLRDPRTLPGTDLTNAFIPQ